MSNFLPTQEEIAFRCMILRMMKNADWPLEVIDDVLLRDNPTVSTVIRLVTRYGHEEALRVIEQFRI